jgi:hypothetical protein
MNWREKNLEDFVRIWEEQIQRIEERAIDSQGTRNIYREFYYNRTLLRFHRIGQEGMENYQKLRNLESQLTVALESSRSIYASQDLGIWARIAESAVNVLAYIDKIILDIRHFAQP